MHMPKRRLDAELVEQGFFPDARQAERAVMAGLVSSGGERLTKPGAQVKPGIALHVKGSRKQSAQGLGTYVSRGGLKLEGALAAFRLDVAGLNCIDVGCSTGGFTDCLLKQGARRVAAVDVGYGQFDWGLRCDGRVALFERTNICDADPTALGAPFALAVADVSFTSIATILPSVLALLCADGLFCTLVKPQFEALSSQVSAGGIVRDPQVHREVLSRVIAGLTEAGMSVRGACVSPIHGAKGNIEYFVLAGLQPCSVAVDVDALVEEAWRGQPGAVRSGGGESLQ